MTVVPLPLRLAAAARGLGEAGSISPAALITADTPVLVGLVRSMMGRYDVPSVFHLLTGGTMTAAGLAATFENRLEVLSGLTRMLPAMARLSALSDMELSLVCLSLPEMLVGLLESGADPDVALAVVEVSDPERLRTNLLEAGVGIDLGELLKQELTVKDAPHLLGALLWDLEDLEVQALAPSVLAFLAPVWRSAFFRAASASPDELDLDRACSAIESALLMGV